MPEARVETSVLFREELRAVESDSLAERVWSVLESLGHYPELGTVAQNAWTFSRFGPGVRKLPVGPFLLLYTYQDGTVIVLALVHGASVI